MRILYYDVFSGISGDMNLAALVDLGVPSDYLIKELEKLGLKGYNIHVDKETKNGIHGTKVEVLLDQVDHTARHLKDIKEIISNSGLSDFVKKSSIRTFEIIGKAEAKVHNKALEEIHFHEVGAIDSIVDIVGASICIEFLSPDKIMSSPVQLGSGYVKCAHGTFPVPAPATSEILSGVPVSTGIQPFESTTPTGAAVLKSFVNEFSSSQELTIEKTAYGLGHQSSDLPNVLRVQLATAPDSEQEKDRGIDVSHYMLECNIDDMNPEMVSHIMDTLFKAGADDVFISPIIMKKSRNASKLTILCKGYKLDEMKEKILKETSSFGLRYYEVEKTFLARDMIELNTRYGKVRVKRAFLNGELLKQKPEYDDCAKISDEQNISIREVYHEVDRMLNDMEKDG